MVYLGFRTSIYPLLNLHFSKRHLWNLHISDLWMAYSWIGIDFASLISLISQLTGGFMFFFYVHLYLGKWSNLTNIFQMGWNHQPANFCDGKLSQPARCRPSPQRWRLRTTPRWSGAFTVPCGVPAQPKVEGCSCRFGKHVYVENALRSWT